MPQDSSFSLRSCLRQIKMDRSVEEGELDGLIKQPRLFVLNRLRLLVGLWTGRVQFVPLTSVCAWVRSFGRDVISCVCVTKSVDRSKVNFSGGDVDVRMCVSVCV